MAVRGQSSDMTGQVADTVIVSRDEYERLQVAALSWWRLWEIGPEVLLADLIDREVVRRIRQASHDLSAACHWSIAMGPGHAELERRRYPWLFDPDWRCRHHHRHGHCPPCATPHTPRQHTGQDAA
jgi:hypothetical protein